MKCRVTIEFQPEEGGVPVLGNLTNISLGGCYVETSTILSAGQQDQTEFLDGRRHPVRPKESWLGSTPVPASPSSSAK